MKKVGLLIFQTNLLFLPPLPSIVVYRCLQVDRDEVEALRQARQLEEEKAQFSVRFILEK